jgi:EAL domain-containing protein (putative c-di-GMP-specific phosphodiesterase class I)
MSVLGLSFAVRAHRLQCSLSMGIVLRAQFAGDADAVLQDASIAMVEAKRSGGGRAVVFKTEMRERAARRQDLEQDLRIALAEGQLFVVYQPVVGFRPGDCSVDSSVGVEALVRWRHPLRGIVPPLDFIGLAEECGLIGELGHQVLDAACRQFVAWRDSLGPRAPRSLAVNLSRGQLELPSIAASVAAVLRDSGMRAQDLQLEITESLAAQDENVQARLSELKALGVTLALDDFGTGYSSLSSLHLLPVDTVKIDRSFVSDAVTSAHHRVLVEATVRVARSLGMSTVAEGIETAEQSALICSLGCDKGQGYHFSRPLPAEELAAWARVR